MTRLSGKIAIVTGGARGMGASHARAFVREGASVVIADRLADLGEALAEELGERAIFARCDVTSAESWRKLVKRAVEEFGTVDVLVNNAGVLSEGSIESTTEADYRRVVEVNQIGAFLGMQAVIPGMVRAGGGAIVNIGSTAAVNGYVDCFPYVASKWALRGMTKAAALELARHRIRVNAVHPGDVETEMTANQRAAGALTTAGIALERFGLPEEVSAAVIFLASDEASYLTGTDLIVDGGYSAS